MNTPENITTLLSHQVFVFGSNTSGIHGKGAALVAKERFGAKQNVAEGMTGHCYAIPTRKILPRSHLSTRRLRLEDMSLEDIQRSVSVFLLYASFRKDLEFLVTKIGCGYAGYTPEQIAPMFKRRPKNVIIPLEFEQVLQQEHLVQ